MVVVSMAGGNNAQIIQWIRQAVKSAPALRADPEAVERLQKRITAVALAPAPISLLAQESSITPRAERVRISEGPEVALVGGYLTVIRWTVDNPGGLPVHYGTSPKNLSQTGKNPIRLNPYHSSTVFRVNLYALPPKTTYYYTVESQDSSGKSDGVASPIKTFTTK
jgi:Purple acid Phosphatase, N-terminal domain